MLVDARGTPPEILEKLNRAINEAAARREIRTKLENVALKVMPGNQKWTQDFVASMIASQHALIETTGLKWE